MLAETANRRAVVLLALGSVAGICLGIFSALRGSEAILHELPNRLPKDAIAVVNGKKISTDEYYRAVAMLASDKRTALTDADRVHVLNRLIEEELLIQGAISHGLVETDRAVRKAMTQAMLAAIVTDSASARPTEEELRAFCEKNRSVFSHSEVRGAGQPLRTRLPAFEQIQNQLEELYLQQAKDTALSEYLAWLRDEAEITFAPKEGL